MSTANVTLTAQWSANTTHTVTYANGGGTGTAPTQAAVSEGASFTVAANTFTRAGYSFTGWNDGTTGYAASASYTMSTANVTLTAQWSAVINGACGTVGATAFVPSTNLCTTGTAGAVTAGSPWAWTCTGSGTGHTDASCTAPNQSTATGTGNGRAVIAATNDWVVDTVNSAGFIATSGDPSGKSPPSLPLGYNFPHGLFDVRLITGTAGSAATVAITYPSALPTGTVYWKYGRTASNPVAHWYQYSGAVISGDRMSINLTLTDNADGDDAYTTDSVIVDPGGPGLPADAPAGATSIPTLSEWGVIILSSLMAMFGLRQARRRSSRLTGKSSRIQQSQALPG